MLAADHPVHCDFAGDDPVNEADRTGACVDTNNGASDGADTWCENDPYAWSYYDCVMDECIEPDHRLFLDPITQAMWSVPEFPNDVYASVYANSSYNVYADFPLIGQAENALIGEFDGLTIVTVSLQTLALSVLGGALDVDVDLTDASLISRAWTALRAATSAEALSQLFGTLLVSDSISFLQHVGNGGGTLGQFEAAFGQMSPGNFASEGASILCSAAPFGVHKVMQAFCQEVSAFIGTPGLTLHLSGAGGGGFTCFSGVAESFGSGGPRKGVVV